MEENALGVLISARHSLLLSFIELMFITSKEKKKKRIPDLSLCLYVAPLKKCGLNGDRKESGSRKVIRWLKKVPNKTDNYIAITHTHTHTLFHVR